MRSRSAITRRAFAKKTGSAYMLPAGAPAGGVGMRWERSRRSSARVRARVLQQNRARGDRCSSPGARAEAVHHVDERLENEQEALLVVAGHLAGELLRRAPAAPAADPRPPLACEGSPIIGLLSSTAWSRAPRAARPCAGQPATPAVLESRLDHASAIPTRPPQRSSRRYDASPRQSRPSRGTS